MPVGADYRYPVIPIERFRKIGLDPPIALMADTRRMRLMVMLSVVLIAGSVYFFGLLDEFEKLVISFGIVVFGVTALYLAMLLLTFSRRATLVFSKTGIDLGIYGLSVEWRDVGPAWTRTTVVKGQAVHQVFFLIRRASVYRRQLRWDRQLLFSFASSHPGRRSSTKADDELSKLRKAALAENDTVAISIPEYLRSGLSSEETAEIINTVVLENNQPSVEEAIRQGDQP